MPRPLHTPRSLLALGSALLVAHLSLAAGALTFAGWDPVGSGGGFAAELGRAALLDVLPGALGGWAAPLVAAAVGRLLLSFLPAGGWGAHATRDLPTTWALSHVLGLGALVAQAGWSAFFGHAPGNHAALLLWPALLALRLLTLPAPPALPRGRSAEAEGAPERLALGAGGIWGGLLLALSALEPESGAPLAAASWLAACVLVVRGLAVGRRGLFARRLAFLALVATPAGLLAAGTGSPASHGAALFAAGGAGLMGWLRTADRRALWVSALAFGTAPAVDERTAVWAVGGSALLVALSARPGQRDALQAAGIGWLVGALPAWVGGGEPLWTLHPGEIGASLIRPGLWSLAWAALGGALLLSILGLAPPRPAAPVDGGSGSEQRALFGLFLWIAFAGLAGAAAELDSGGGSASEALLLLLPLTTLALGLRWLPAERSRPSFK